MLRVLGLIASLLLMLAPESRAESVRYDWSGPSFTTASGTVSLAHNVSGFLVLEGPVENLPFGNVSPTAFSFSAGPVAIDDATPLHALTLIRLQTDSNGDVVATEIQLVQEIDTGAGLLAADVICVGSCPAAGNQDAVIDRNALGAVLGTGEVPITSSFWSAPTPLGPSVPALSPLSRLLLVLGLAAGARALRVTASPWVRANRPPGATGA